MTGASIRRRSVTLQGHRTSVSMEDAFWTQLKAIAVRRGLSINALVAEADAARPPDDPGNLSSALRLLVLEDALAGARLDQSSGNNTGRSNPSAVNACGKPP